MAASVNSSRLDTLEATVADLAAQVAGISGGSSVSIDTFYATDLTFLLTNGDLNVPVVDGNVTPPGSVGTGHDWHPYPGLTNVSFNVEEDDTVVLFQSIGRVAVLQFNAFASIEFALRVDGVIPERGATGRLTIVTDDTVSSGSQYWNLLHATTLASGQHTFTVMVRVLDGSANEASMTLDGRSGPGYDGKIKAVLMKVR
ncbi:MAG: hypothetical protein WA989_10350, partial [Henriciella sp.]|uniref:hypothetical protein n=1 Tax=Henriciella sp. TaxID=1968823 RepID=UPI003C72B784